MVDSKNEGFAGGAIHYAKGGHVGPGKVCMPSLEGDYIPFATVNNIKFVPLDPPQPALGISSIDQWWEEPQHVACFRVKTIDLNTAAIEVHPTVLITGEVMQNYGDDTELAHYIATTVASHIGWPSLVPSLKQALLQSSTKYFAVAHGNFWSGTFMTSQEKIKASSHKPTTDRPEALSGLLPGITTRVKHPVVGGMQQLRDVIMNLNDHHGWSRERIADWLDEISDPTGETGPDLRFKPKDDTLEQLEIDEPVAYIEDDYAESMTIQAKQLSVNFEITPEATEKLLNAIQNYKEESDEQD